MNCPNCGRGNPENSSFCNSCSAKFATLLPLTHATETKLLSKPVSSDFVGREREMGVLEAALEHARAGHGRLVMLVGEPGIGKTRTARELAAIAEQRGVQVLWGRCYEGEGAPPYWPWVQTIRSYVQQKDSEQLRTEMGPGAGTISEIVPELRDKLPGLELPPTLDSPESARFRLFDSITTFLKRVSQNHPIFVMLDDLHWADKSSLLLLEFMSRELSDSSMLIVSTYRDSGLSQQHPFYETLVVQHH